MYIHCNVCGKIIKSVTIDGRMTTHVLSPELPLNAWVLCPECDNHTVFTGEDQGVVSIAAVREELRKFNIGIEKATSTSEVICFYIPPK